jgi:hypothetical protein
MLNATDILVLAALVVNGATSSTRQLATKLGLSKSQIANSIRRLIDARLLLGGKQDRRIVRLAVRELLSHGLRYLCPARLDGIALGLLTAHSFEPIAKQLLAEGDPLIMPLAEGPRRGRVLVPIHPRAPEAAAADSRMHEVLALLDALRVGRARERELATDLLRRWL